MEEKITCPKCGIEQPLFTDSVQKAAECIRCGIVFSKFDPARNTTELRSYSREELRKPVDMYETVDRWWYRSGKIFIIGLMGFFFFYMVVKRSSWCFLDHVNLPFHEFGHILFSPFGETVQFLGGTIGQLMWPAILLLYFIRRHDHLASSFCLFWFGENFLNISKYIADARSMILPLVGGGIHDWNTLLGKWDMLRYDRTIGKGVFFIGVILMTASIVWAILITKGRKVNNGKRE
jgi:hypothetical protein